MDIALRGFAAEHPQTGTANVAYSIWRDEGMGARMGSVDLLQEKGIDAIPTDEGVNRFLKIFTHDPGSCQIVVTARMGGLDTWNQALPDAPQGWRFLEAKTHYTPGVEVVFSTHLSLETDPYLTDHHFQGSYLFPTVFGLEAMAQAALYLCGKLSLSQVQIRDVRLLRPITVDPESGTDIIVRAIVAEEQGSGETVVHAGIVKQGTGIQSDFFAATFVFDAVDSAPVEAIAHPDMPHAPGCRRPIYTDPACFSRDLGSRASRPSGRSGKPVNKPGQPCSPPAMTPAAQRRICSFWCSLRRGRCR